MLRWTWVVRAHPLGVKCQYLPVKELLDPVVMMPPNVNWTEQSQWPPGRRCAPDPYGART